MIARTILALLAARSPNATVCPSEVARSLAKAAGTPNAWRNLMPAIHAAVDEMMAGGAIELT